jgi:hypothetical protein
MKPESFYQRISSIMRDNQYDRTVSGFRSGQLGKKVYKAAMDCDRVFDRKVEHSNKNYDVVLVVDESGSMGGRKILVAAQSCCMMARALEKSHINFCIIGYNRFVRIHKHFDEHPRLREYKEIEKEILSSVDYGGGCTHDYMALIQVDELIKGKNPDNTVVMLFEDGGPGCGCGAGAANPQGKLDALGKRIAKKSKFIVFNVEGYQSNIYPLEVPISNLNQFMARSLYALQAIIQRT